MRTSAQWWLVGGVAVAFGALLTAQQWQAQRLRSELERLRAEQDVARRSIAEMRKVDEARVAAVASRGEEAAELSRLRADVAALKARFADIERAERNEPPVETVRSLAVSDWRNAGRGTPQAALETALWAAAAGELGVLAETLVLDERAREAAEQLLKNLPPEARKDYERPERLIALLAAKDVPASTVMAQVAELRSEAAEGARLRVKLKDASGATRTTRLTLRPGAGGWGIVLSDRDVTRFAANLKR